MEGHGDALEVEAVDESQVLVDGVVPELPGAEGEEPAELTNQSRSLGHLLVDECHCWAQGFQPHLLDGVHLMITYK